MGGTQGPVGPAGSFFLREPYRFDEPDSQMLVSITNLELVQNTVQIVFYGVAMLFNAPKGNEFPGGPVSSTSTLTPKFRTGQ